MQLRGYKAKKWWIIFRDQHGKIRQENTKTTDPDEAKRLLARRSLDRARLVVAILEKVADGAKTTKRRTSEGHRQAGATGAAGKHHPSAKADAGNRKKNSQRGNG
jgi:hypothetical protein